MYVQPNEIDRLDRLILLLAREGKATELATLRQALIERTNTVEQARRSIEPRQAASATWTQSLSKKRNG
jgi:hypothetical protein